ncbi:MAG: aminoacyl-tRNA deacylase [Proteobacteria bacterium]|nr:aminoacyl-tRNA deacylase [Pseudomonadota bacterium]
MTPAINALKKAGVAYQLHSYANAVSTGYAEEAVLALDLPAEQVFKTLIVLNESKLAVAVIPANLILDLKAAADLLRWKKCALADQAVAERRTGFLKGGISPFGQKTRLPTLLDEPAMRFATIFVSGGRRGLDVEVDPADLIRLCDAKLGTIGKMPPGRKT